MDYTEIPEHDVSAVDGVDDLFTFTNEMSCRHTCTDTDS